MGKHQFPKVDVYVEYCYLQSLEGASPNPWSSCLAAGWSGGHRISLVVASVMTVAASHLAGAAHKVHTGEAVTRTQAVAGVLLVLLSQLVCARLLSEKSKFFCFSTR